MIPTQHQGVFDTFLSGMTRLISTGLRAGLGPSLDQKALGPFTRADLATAACLAGLVLAARGVLALTLRRMRSSSASKEGRLSHVLGRPLALLFWIFGAYIVAVPLLDRLSNGTGLWALRQLFGDLFDVVIFAFLAWLFFRFTGLLETLLKERAAGTASKFDDIAVPLVIRTLRVMVPVIGIILALPVLGLPPAYAGLLSKGSSILLILAVAAVAMQAVTLGQKAVLAYYDIKAADNLKARKVYTQAHVLARAAYVLVALFAAASVLMLFKEVRSLGTSLLASAGVVGVIVGFAAQKTIANLFAGFQLALTEPIRLDDVVIVEGEWGNVEEITLTYVIIRIWDDRRLVVPLSDFIEKPFQNWTRVSAGLLGSVLVWVDYTLPLEDIRAALKEIIEGHPLWDRRFWNLQVTDATERSMQIRVLATAENSSKSWDLRCAIREKLIAYIQKNHPQCLPRLRASVDSAQTPLVPT